LLASSAIDVNCVPPLSQVIGPLTALLASKQWHICTSEEVSRLPLPLATRHSPLATLRGRAWPGEIPAKRGPLVPETPERREAAPALSHELHREAPTGAVDPVTACPGEFDAPTQEGG